MKEYILISVCMLAGRYVDAPIWQTAFAVAGAVWAMNQITEAEKWSD